MNNDKIIIENKPTLWDKYLRTKLTIERKYKIKHLLSLYEKEKNNK